MCSFLDHLLTFPQAYSHLPVSLSCQKPQAGHLGAAVQRGSAPPLIQPSCAACGARCRVQLPLSCTDLVCPACPGPPAGLLLLLASELHCTAGSFPSSCSWHLSVSPQVPTKPGLQLAKVPPEGSLSFQQTTGKAGSWFGTHMHLLPKDCPPHCTGTQQDLALGIQHSTLWIQTGYEQDMKPNRNIAKTVLV